MPVVSETPSRKIRFQELDSEVSADVDSCGSDVNGGDRVVAPPCFDLNEDPSFWKENNVQVLIRIRPLSSSEISLQGQNRCVRQDSCQSITWTGHPECRFTFDHVAGELISQEDLFKVAGVPMVDNCVGGYNSCMFAYGQTGSGKTHTMLGDIEGGTRRHSVNAGMTPRVFEYLFSRIQKEREARREEKLCFVCKCSFLEIYNEQILDLLEPSSSNLQIREDARKGIYVENLAEFEVSSARDVMQQLVQGASNRKVASTNMNRASSRSHSVFTCSIESKWESQSVTHHRFARLNLVDLAGSERQKSSGAEGERLKEATNINKSLSTLGLVIMNLVSISNKKPLHVPYRDSKLTFLLQDSLGGNSKTIIIANISPSNCCALETLSTLKFAQRAKFIRNNAIINEDASGDVIAMRMQIQQLKKEVNRLQGLVNEGHDHQEGDNMNFTMIDSPGCFKWNEGSGTFTPLTFNKKISQRKDYETVLVAAIRRDQDKDKMLHALIAEKQAAEQLASQRSDEVQGLKMRLRFREERIKRLEAVSLGKLSAETHLLKEKEEFSKEIEHLRNHVDRNREATRFAMENLQLKEELRRLQSFVEEGERDMLHQQIALLQDKLLEALDWKLMHEKDTDHIQGSLDFSSTNDEMEFLHLQAIQNQREVDAIRKNLSSCLEMKEKLERKVDELTLQLEEQRKPMTTDGSQLVGSIADVSSDQFELKAMVEAIASASQREAEAHETTITLAKENEELHAKLKVLIDDNNKLIELCENLSGGAGNSSNASCQNNGLSELIPESHLVDKSEVENISQRLHEMREENEKLITLYEQCMCDRDAGIKSIEHLEQQVREMHEENGKLIDLYEQSMHERNMEKKNIERLEQQLQEMHEENDKLMCLYEESMRDRDAGRKNIEHLEQQVQEMHEENGKLIDLYEQSMHERNVEKKNIKCLEQQLQEMHEENDKLICLYEAGMQERDMKTMELKALEFQFQELHRETEKLVSSKDSNNLKNQEEICCPEELAEVDYVRPYCNDDDQHDSCETKTDSSRLGEHLNLVQSKLDIVQENFQRAFKVIDALSFVEKETKELLIIADKLETMYLTVQLKQQDIASLRFSLSVMQDRRVNIDKKLLTFQDLYLKVQSLEDLELQARTRVDASSVLVERKKEELSSVRTHKQQLDAACLEATDLDAQLRAKLNSLKLKYQQMESQRRETEKVLFAIDNLEKKDNKTLHFGKASELLKSEEERTKLTSEIKQSRERLVALEKEISSYQKDIESSDAKILDLEAEVKSGILLLEVCGNSLEKTIMYKERFQPLYDECRDAGKLLLDFQEAWFECNLKESEIHAYTEELQSHMEELESLKTSRNLLVGECEQLLKDASKDIQHVGEMVDGEFEDIHRIVTEAKSLISSSCTKESSACLLPEISLEAPVVENVNCTPVPSVELSCPTLDVACPSITDFIMPAEPQVELAEDPFVDKEEEVTKDIEQLKNAHCNPTVQTQHLIDGGENATEAHATCRESSTCLLPEISPEASVVENVNCTPVPSVELSCPTLDVASPSITDFIMPAEPQVELAEDQFVDKEEEVTKDIEQLKNAHCNSTVQTRHLIDGDENYATEAHATCRESSTCLLPEISPETSVVENVNCIPVSSVELSCPTLDVASCPSSCLLPEISPEASVVENVNCIPVSSVELSCPTLDVASCPSSCLLPEISPEAPVVENVNCIPVSSVELSFPTLDVASCPSTTDFIISAKPQGDLSEDPFVHKEEEVTESIKQLKNAQCNPSVQAQHLMAKPIGGGENHATEAQAEQQSSSKRSILEKETPSFDLKENVGIMCGDCTNVQVEETETGMARKLGRATMEEMRLWSMRKLRKELQALSLEGNAKKSTNKNDRRTALATLNENCLNN